jgi:hypothetical protein
MQQKKSEPGKDSKLFTGRLRQHAGKFFQILENVIFFSSDFLIR